MNEGCDGMKKLLNPMIAIVINWFLFVAFARYFMRDLYELFPRGNGNLHTGENYYGPGAFSITVIFVFFVLGIIYNHICIRVRTYDKESGYEFAANLILVISFTIQSAIVLNYFGLP